MRKWEPGEEDLETIARLREFSESNSDRLATGMTHRRQERWNRPIGLNDDYQPFRVHQRGASFQQQIPTWPDAVLGMLIGGAVGDALGEPIEFLSIARIREQFGSRGITGYLASHARISDDTQMSLFTLEGMLEAHLAGRSGDAKQTIDFVKDAYLRWLRTQRESYRPDGEAMPGWLYRIPELWVQRAPGSTCLSALSAIAAGRPAGTSLDAINDSKGCGGVMRVAPVALYGRDRRDSFGLAVDAAAITHGHPSGYLSAGALASILRDVLDRHTLPEAVDNARAELANWPGHDELITALDRAVALASDGPPSPERLADSLGGGWVGEEALAIAVCAALAVDNFQDGVLLAVNHSGDSDSTGAVAGNILGAYYGAPAIPDDLWDHVEMREVIESLAADAITTFGDYAPVRPNWADRYRTSKPSP